MIQNPQSFVTRQECDKITFQNGFRRTHGETDGWRRYGSTTAQGSIWLATKQTGRWLLSIDPAGGTGHDYSSETFRVLKDKKVRTHGEYRTHRLVLAAWDRMEANSEFTDMGR